MFNFREDIKCGRRDSNPHALRRQILSLVRLPITPLPRLGLLLWHKDRNQNNILQVFSNYFLNIFSI